MKAKVLIWGAVALAAGLAAGIVLASGHGPGGGAGCPFGRGAMGAGMFGHGHGHGERLHDLIDDLELSAAQKESIKDILRQSHERLEPKMEEAHAAQRAVFDAALAPEADEAAVRAAGEAAGRVVSDLSIEFARALSSIRGTLTPGQRQELDRRIDEHRERHRERAGRFREFRHERFEEFLEAL